MSGPDDSTPPCPVCGNLVNIEWCDVRSMGDSGPVWLPAGVMCPANRGHDVAAALVELSWPTELTDDDRMWLRRQARLALDRA